MQRLYRSAREAAGCGGCAVVCVCTGDDNKRGKKGKENLAYLCPDCSTETGGQMWSRKKMTAFLTCVWGLVWSKGDHSGQPPNCTVIRGELQWLCLPKL